MIAFKKQMRLIAACSAILLLLFAFVTAAEAAATTTLSVGIYSKEILAGEYYQVSASVSKSRYDSFVVRGEIYKDGVLYAERTYTDTSSYKTSVSFSMNLPTDDLDPFATYSAKFYLYGDDGVTQIGNVKTITGLTTTPNNEIGFLKWIAAEKKVYTLGETIRWRFAYDVLTDTSIDVINLATGNSVYDPGVEYDFLDANESSFTYKPTAAGLYWLRIKADAHYSGKMFEDALVKVVDPSKPQIDVVHSECKSCAVGQANTWNAEACGGTGSLEYSFTLLRGNTQVHASGWTSSASYSHTFTASGDYTLKVRVRDTNGNLSLEASNSFTVNASLAIRDVASDRAYGYSFDQISWTAEAAGNTESIEYQWKVYRDGTEVSTSPWQSAGSCSYTPSFPGVYTAEVRARNTNGDLTNYVRSADVVVTDMPAINNIGCSAATATPIDKCKWYAGTSGGHDNLEYHFMLYKDGELYQDYGWSDYPFHITTMLPDAGSYVMKASMRDQYGNETQTLSCSALQVIDSIPELGHVSIPSTGKVNGDALTCSPVYSGGDGTIKLYYRLSCNGVEYDSGYAADNKIEFGQAGTNTVTFYVMDQDGDKSNEYTARISVDSAPIITDHIFSTTEILAGQPFTITPVVSGGDGQLEYSYKIYAYKMNSYSDTLPTDAISTSDWTTNPELTFCFSESTPTSYFSYGRIKSYRFDISVRDEDGDESGYTIYGTNGNIYPYTGITVGNAPSVISVIGEAYSGDPSINVFVPYTWNTICNIGAAPLTFHYTLYRNGEVYDKLTTTNGVINSYYTNRCESEFTYTFTEGGEYQLEVWVEDGIRKSKPMKGVELPVIDHRPYITGITAASEAVNAGETQRWSFTSEGGTGAHEYFCRIISGDQVYASLGWTTTPECSYTFTEGGEYRLEVQVSDAEGNQTTYSRGPVTYVIDPNKPVTAVNIAAPETLAYSAGDTVQLSASVVSSGNGGTKLVWSSSNAAIATVSENGLVTMLKPGYAVITASAKYYPGVSGQIALECDLPEPVYMPANLKEIQDEAMAHTAVEYIALPSGTTKIGSRAFADCPNLLGVIIPATVTTIAPDAFENSPMAVIVTPSGSHAHSFALTNKIPVAIR